MSFFLIDFQTKDPEYKKYNGRIALTLGWSPNNNEPFLERWITITSLLAKDRSELINESYPYYAAGVHQNRIWFHSPYPISFETDDMPKFTERVPVPMPRRPWQKAWGGGRERKKYEWIFGKWVHVGWEEEEEDDSEYEAYAAAEASAAEQEQAAEDYHNWEQDQYGGER